jgi:hypothetical protein
MRSSLLKYIIVARDGREFPVIFDPAIQHSTMVPAGGFTPVSAGFFLAADGHVVVADIGSDSLKLNPRVTQDRAILQQTLNLSQTINNQPSTIN